MVKVQFKNLEKFWKLTYPRNVAVIGSGKFGKDANFMACAWFTPLSEDIPTCGIVIDKESYTYELISKYNEFSVNILPFEKANIIMFVGSTSGREVNKLEKLKAFKGKKTDVPILEDAIGFIECKVINSLDIAEVKFFIGKVVNAEYEKDLFDEHYGFNLKKVKIPLHIKGNLFTTTSEEIKEVK